MEDVTDIHCYDIIQCYAVSSLVFCLLGPEINDTSVLELDARGMNLNTVLCDSEVRKYVGMDQP